MTTVMITGVGAIIGYGLLHSIRQARPDIRLVGCDIYADAVGQTWCDIFEQAPLTSSPVYPKWLRSVIEKHKVDLLIPGIEQDVQRLSEERDTLSGLQCILMLNCQKLIKLSQDKWLMHQTLLASGDNTRIPSYLDGNYDWFAENMGVPFILKPRCGYASKGLVKVQNRDDFTAHSSQLGNVLMAQPLIGSDDEEYTVAIFGDGNGNIFCSITMQRYLAKDGSTAKAWVRQNASLDIVVQRLCHHFKPIGPTNLQFRRDNDGWKLLEINPRISSTSSMRTAFGYNEALMCIEYYLEGKIPAQPDIRSGFATRYIQDHIIYDWDNF